MLRQMFSPSIRTELRALLRLAWPVIVSQLGMMMMGVVDTIMIGRLGADAMAAVAVGNIYGFALLIVPLGILMGLDPIVSQAWGAGNREAAGRAMWRGFFLAALLAIPLSAGWALAGVGLQLLGQPQEIIPAGEAYVFWLIPGSLGVLWYSVLRQSMQAIGIVRPTMIVTLIANGFNFVANWALIYGNLGMPAMGVEGSAIATSLSRWFMLFLLIGLVSWQGQLKALRPKEPFRVADWSAIGKMVRIGIPIGLQIGAEVWAFSLAGVAVGWFGAVPLAGHQVALQWAAVAFMVPIGLSAAASARVGQAVGKRDYPEMRRSAWVSLAVGTGVMVVSAAIFAIFPAQLASIYTDDRSVILMAASLLPIAAMFQVFDGMQVVGFGILRGTGDTRFAMVINFVGYYAVALPVGALLAFSANMEATGIWMGLVAGLVFVAALIVLRMRVLLRRDIQPVTAE